MCVEHNQPNDDCNWLALRRRSACHLWHDCHVQTRQYSKHSQKLHIEGLDTRVGHIRNGTWIDLISHGKGY